MEENLSERTVAVRTPVPRYVFWWKFTLFRSPAHPKAGALEIRRDRIGRAGCHHEAVKDNELMGWSR